MKQVKVFVNDLKQTFVGSVGYPDLPHNTSRAVMDLNSIFASQGLNWFAVAEDSD